MDDLHIKWLNYYLRTYDGLNKLIVASKNRLQAMIPGAKVELQKEIHSLEKTKGRLSYRIGKELDYWPIWTEYLIGVPGIGPYLGGNLVMLYYYKHIPICSKCEVDLVEFKCPECGEEVKGQGNLVFRIEDRDFPNVSKWHEFLGEGNDPKTKRMKQRMSLATFRKYRDKHYPDEKLTDKQMREAHKAYHNWSIRGRNISWEIGVNFNRHGDEHLYKRHCNKLKEKGAPHYSAIRQARKLFLSHFWHVAREIAGKSTEGPWITEWGPPGHTFIPPHYWKKGGKKS